MASNRFRAIAISFAIAIAPMSAAPVWAADPPVTAASVQLLIKTTVQARAAQDGFKTLDPDAKATALQAAVLAALESSGATPEMIAQALVRLVADGTIPAGLARAVAASNAALATAFNNAIVTASLGGPGAPTLLVPVSGAGVSNGATPLATYDPCAGVIASYCG